MNSSFRVLVVEDEPGIGMFCARTLTREGFDVTIANNGILAKEIIANGRDFDLCLIDIRVPLLNGMELYRFLEKEHKEMTNSVIFTTGDLLSGIIEEFLKEVNRPCLNKPFISDELKEVIRKTLEEKGNSLALSNL